mgnify:CR=1 FL=1
MSDLTDLEICKRIAEIEGLKVASLKEVIARDYREDTCIILPRKNEHCSRSYSYEPLTDDALCFRLMVKYGLEASPMGDGSWSVTVIDKRNIYGEPDYRLCEYGHTDTQLSKAICLAIIEANSNDK